MDATGFPSDQQARLQRHGQETQRRAEQLERARQANAISPGAPLVAWAASGDVVAAD